MKKLISMLLALCLLAALGPARAEEAPSQGKPYTNPNLYTEFTERPGPEENFFIYMNYDFLVQGAADIHYWQNDDRGRAFHYLSEEGLEICRNTEYTDPESQIVQIVYSLAADKEKREQDAYAALDGKISRVKAVKTTQELTTLLREEGFRISTPFLNTSNQPRISTDLYLTTVDKIQVLPFPPNTVGNVEPDKEASREKLVRMGYGEEEARRLVDEIARYDDDFTVEVPDWLQASDGVYEPVVSLKEIRENCPVLYALLTGVGLAKEDAETKPAYEIEPLGLSVFLKWYTDENLETLKAIVALRLYDDTEEVMHRDSIYAIYTDSEEMVLFQDIMVIAEIPMTQAYVTHYCPEEKWEMATDLFEETRSAMRERILANTWLSEESKQKAIEKLEDMVLSPIVAPGGSFDCGPLLEALRDCDDLLDAAALCRRFKNQCLLRYTGEKIDTSNPYTSGIGVMALGGQYLPQFNIFCIGAPALNGSFCDPTSRETLLGTLGMHISHEVSHGFDSLGAMRDVTGTGTLFTDEDLRVFNEKTASIASLLDKVETGNGYHVMGDQVTYEAMADLTGMCLMLDLAKKEENFDYDAFFRAFAGFYFLYDYGNVHMPNEAGRVDTHPPYYVRFNYTVSQFEEFYRTYPSVTEGTPMYVAPENRILAW